MATLSEIARGHMQHVCGQLETYFAEECGERMAVFLIVRPFGPPRPGERGEWISNMAADGIPAFVKEMAHEVTLQAAAMVTPGRVS